MNFIELIRKKRNGQPLTATEISSFITGYVAGEIPDYQVAALLMAICFQNLNEQETVDLTFAMRDSGAQIDLSSLSGVTVDKHSTGGVGDTTSLIVGPIVAACGVNVAKMSGRGLGHTGGTLDKLEAIPGFSTNLSMDRFLEIVGACHLSIIGQSKELVPADRLLYGLRDATSTVDNIPLIAASIMSKKLASGADAILLDVKTGNGAFMERFEEAEQLAETMVNIGERAGRKVQALVTDMSQPLGLAVGNSLEVQEAIGILRCSPGGALQELSIELASRMLVLGRKCRLPEEGRALAEDALTSGRALATLKKMIIAHGGDPTVCEDITLLPRASRVVPVSSPHAGYISGINTLTIGQAALLLGAGRLKKGDPIDLSVGVVMKKRLGDTIAEAEVVADIHCNREDRLQEVIELITNAFIITKKRLPPPPLIYSNLAN